MEGLEVAEVNIKDIDLSDRIDAEFFNRTDLRMQSMLREKGALPLSTYCDFVASAFYPAATQLYDKGDTPFVRCVDCISHPVITKDQDDTFEKIPREFIECNDGICSLRRNDIVLTKVGTPCFASLIAEHDFIALSRTVMGLQDVHDIDPRYLMVFLRSKYGYSQLLRLRELTIQYQLTVDRVKRVLISRANEDVERKVCSLVDRYIESERHSRKAYLDAERMLLDELGFSAWRPSDEGVSIKSLSDTIAANRMDAEYFLPKYDELMQALSTCEKMNLGGESGLADLYKSIDPSSDCYGNEGIPFVRISDFSKFGIDHPAVCLPKEVCAGVCRIKKDSILLTKDGSVGMAYKAECDLDMVTSGAIVHLTLKNERVNPDYLTLVLNSRIVQMQAERDAGGSIIQHWKPSQIERVQIPILPMSAQGKIVEKIRESFWFRDESRRLIESAKSIVEDVLENG